MYTGITRGLFPVVKADSQPGLLSYVIELSPELTEGLTIGASVNVDGVCQTAKKIESHLVSFDAMQETLDCTTLNELKQGSVVSIERSFKYGDENGGHDVFGHVNGTATVEEVLPSQNNLTLTLRCSPDWMKYILPKGFIAVDGSSLTVGETDPEGLFKIHLIPETIRVTNFGNKKVGDRVNIELDSRTRTIVDTVERVIKAKNY